MTRNTARNTINENWEWLRQDVPKLLIFIYQTWTLQKKPRLHSSAPERMSSWVIALSSDAIYLNKACEDSVLMCYGYIL